MRAGLRRFVLVGVLALAPVTACGADGGGQAAPRTLPPLPSTQPATPSATPAGSPTTGPAPDPVHPGPPPTTPFTRHGAEQFVRAYYLTANRAMATGRVDDLMAYSLPSCPCRKFARDISDFTRRGQHIEARGYRIEATRAVPIVGNVVPVAVTFSLDNLRVFDATGHQVDGTVPIHRRLNTVVLVRQGQRWRIQQIVLGPRS